MADISIIHDGDTGIDYNIKDSIGRATCASGLQNLEDCIISILPESVIDDAPPISFLTNGDSLSSVVLSGNGQQTETPTPDSPVMPEFVGVRMGNLFDYRTMSGTITEKYLNANGELVNDNSWGVTDYIPCGGTDFTIGKIGGGSPSICFYDANKNFINGKNYNTPYGAQRKTNITATSSSEAKFIRFSYCIFGYPDDLSKIMLNSGSTAPPYEPYGYKIPITCAGQTVPIYLGQTQTVRRVKKLLLYGTETIAEESANVYSIPISDTVIAGTGISTHFVYDEDVADGQYRIDAGKAVFGYDNTQENFAAFLAAQYATGTPVTVWYVLATPQTAIVNEPLCKIGDYADELSSEDDAVTIPTARGQNTLSVETDLQPSRIKVIGNIVGTGETESHTVTDKVDTPTDIPSNSDIDTYTIDGVYRITDISIAATILHAPITNAKYILEVFSLSDTDKIQRITTGTDIYTRQKSSGVWGSWYKFTGTEVT